MDNWKSRREKILQFAQRKLAEGVLDKSAVEVIDAQLKRGINDRSKRLRCIEHIEVELDGIDGCSGLDLSNWKRLYSKGRARRHQKGANLQLPNAKKNNEAHRKEHRKKQHQDSGSTHTKRAHGSVRRRDHRRDLSKKKKKQHAWNEIDFAVADLVPKKLPQRVVAKHRAKIAKAQRVQALRKEDGVIIPSPPSRCVNNKRFFGNDFDAIAQELKTNKSIMYNESESSYAIESAASKRRPNSNDNKKRRMARKSITRSSSTRTNRTDYVPFKNRANSAIPGATTKEKRKSIMDTSKPRLTLDNLDQIESHVHATGNAPAPTPLRRFHSDEPEPSVSLVPFESIDISDESEADDQDAESDEDGDTTSPRIAIKSYNSIPYIPEMNTSGEPENHTGSIESIPDVAEANTSAEPESHIGPIESIPDVAEAITSAEPESHIGPIESIPDVAEANTSHNYESDFSLSFSSDEEDEEAKRRRMAKEKKEPLVLGKHLHVLSECPAAYSWALEYELGSGWHVVTNPKPASTQISTGPLGDSDYGNSESFDATPAPTPRSEDAPVQTTGLAAVSRSNKDENDCNVTVRTPTRRRSNRLSLRLSASFDCLGMHTVRMLCSFLSAPDMRACLGSSPAFSEPVLGASAIRLLPRIFEVKCVEDFVNIIIGAGICTADFVPRLDGVVNWFNEFSTSGSSPECEHQFIDKVVRLLQVADDICAAPDLEAQANRFQANLIRAYVQVPELHDLAKAIVPTVFEKASYPLYGIGLTNTHQTKSFLPDENRLLSVEQPLIPFDYRRFEQRSEQFGAPECESNILIDAKDDSEALYTETKDDRATVDTKTSGEAKDGDDDSLPYTDEKDSASDLDMVK